jgi:hypothetical protein
MPTSIAVYSSFRTDFNRIGNDTTKPGGNWYLRLHLWANPAEAEGKSR